MFFWGSSNLLRLQRYSFSVSYTSFRAFLFYNYVNHAWEFSLAKLKFLGNVIPSRITPNEGSKALPTLERSGEELLFCPLQGELKGS